MIIIAIDPGPTTSGVVVLDATDWPPTVMDTQRKVQLTAIRWLVARHRPQHIAVEGIVPYLRSGAVIGAAALDTARTIGRIEEMAEWAIRDGHAPRTHLLTRPEVAGILCPGAGGGTPTGAQVAEAIRDLYRRARRATGGGVDPVIGTKREPGPLHGIALSQHEGSALAVGLAWLMKEKVR
jgi:hypothetical protein